MIPILIAAAGGAVVTFFATQADDAAENFGLTGGSNQAPNTLQVFNSALSLALVVAVLYGAFYLFTRR